MGIDYVYISIVILLSHFSGQGFTFTVESANENVTVTGEGVQYVVTMQENNHVFVDSTALIYLNGLTSDECLQTSVSILENSNFQNEIRDDCILYALQSFDYEKNQRNYLFVIRSDSENSVTVRLTITNYDDEPPVMGAFNCTFDEKEQYTVENSNCSTLLSDPDGWINQTTFNIIPGTGNVDGLFEIDFAEPILDDLATSSLVYLYPTQELNYDTGNLYLFTVNAMDGAGHYSDTQDGMVKVNNVRSRYPKWTQLQKYDEFLEKEEQNFEVQAVDGDTGINANLYFTKTYEDIEKEAYIEVDYDTGYIHVNPIDRDKYDLSTYSFNISACVVDLDNWCTSEQVQYYITDIDDNPPRIMENDFDNTTVEEFDSSDSNKEITLSYLENYDKSYNFTTKITDIDTGENAQFEIVLENVEGHTVDYTEPYLIVPSSGYRTGSYRISVKDKTKLDFEDDAWKVHQYYVVSYGTKNASMTDRMLVNVNLIDYNDELPIFQGEPYAVSINETTPKDTLVITTEATDRDAEDKVLEMAIQGSYAVERLRINSDGEIYVDVDNAFDYDVLQSVYFQVTATDKVKHITYASVTITILDVNNKAPTIDPVDYIEVEENQQNGVYLNVTITASDLDTTAYLTSNIDWDKSYVTKTSGILEKNDIVTEAMQFLEVENTQLNDGRSLSVRLKVINNNDDNPNKPDFETFDSLFLVLTVTDLNTDPEFLDKQQTSATMLISIKDINDNPPYFPASNDVNRTVQESASVNTSVGFLSAIDPDLVDTEMYYYCTAERNDFDWVTVNLDTGAFSVIADNLVNADEPPTSYFNYTCWAHDGLFFSEPLFVSLYIIDTNNKDPQTDLPDVVNITEKSPADTPIDPKIGTSDMDRDIPFHTVVCNLRANSEETTECSEQFHIDNNVIIVTNGNGSINRDDGRPTFTCYMECIDNQLNERYQGSRSTNKSFTIKLIDLNDNAPELITTEIDCLETIKKDMSIDVIEGKDIDEGRNAEIDFDITSIINIETDAEMDIFLKTTEEEDYMVNDTIKQVHLVATKDLEGFYGTYTVMLHMQDRGDIPQETDSSFTLTIDKYNFNPPEIEFPVNNGMYFLLSEQTPGQPLKLYNTSGDFGDLTATDGATEDCSKWDVRFTLLQNNDTDDFFKIHYLDRCRSRLEVTEKFDPNNALYKSHDLTVTAWVKEGDPPPGGSASSSSNIIIKFLDNQAQPTFPDTTWEVQFIEANIAQPPQQLDKPASYFDDDYNLPIYYLFNSDNETLSDLFEVNSTTGALSVIGDFYYDDDQQFQFEIVASNDSNIESSTDPKSHLLVTVKVLPTNRRAPYWVNPPFFGTIMLNYQSGTVALTAQGFDEDYIDKGNLECCISGDIEAHGTGLENIISQSFSVQTQNDICTVYVQFTVENTMTGYFTFTLRVSDHEDDYGNGPYSSDSNTTVFIITSENTVDFNFYNDITEVQDRQTEMLDIITNNLGYKAYRQRIDPSKNNQNEEITVARLYFIDSSGDNTELITSDVILGIVTDLNTFTKLASDLRNQQKLILTSFDSISGSTNNEIVLRAWLTGVSVVMGILIAILSLTLILKTRQLQRRISNLTTRKFGSQESGLNRIGVSAPTTNKHAIEGSNPVYKSEEIQQQRNMNNADTFSVKSGDSDLIGVEDNPEFDYNFNINEEKITDL